MRARWQDDGAYLRVLLPIESSFQSSLDYRMSMANLQGVQIGQCFQALCEGGQDRVHRVARKTDGDDPVYATGKSG